VHWLAGGELAIHACSGNSHALLAAGLAQLVEFRTIEQFAEDPPNLALDDAGAVVLERN
jgi:hypothetical protein